LRGGLLRDERPRRGHDEMEEILTAMTGTATWSWKCPSCSAEVVARRAVGDSGMEALGALVEFTHREPLCSEFESNDEVLQTIVEAWKKGEFVTTDAGSGPS
jgi:hypothetical protein